jgi:hypothetical protein
MMPVFARMMRGTVRREIAALKELCETGTVAGREGMKAEIGQP